MINRIHIQTIDSCNANCVMCPYKSIEHTHKEIDQLFFERIISEVNVAINQRIIIQDPEIYLFFNNEPLLDSKIFDRIEFIKSNIPKSKVILFSNAILLEKYKEQLVNSRLELLYISLYGYDSESFVKLTGVKITQRKFERIIESIEEIKDKINIQVSNSWEGVDTEAPKIKDYSSRAGYYGENILYEHVVGCRHERNKNWLNILDTGEAVLCCMDWKKEQVLGNLKTQSIKEIVSSAHYKNVYLQTIGEKESPDRFICKRCEWAIPGTKPPKSKKKQLIITAISENKVDYLYDFLISLKEIADFKGEVVVLGYKLSFATISFINYFGAKHIACSVSDNYKIVNTRLLDVYNFLKQSDYKDFDVVLFDADIWFNASLNELFYEVSHIEGCYYGTEYRPDFFEFGKGRGPGDEISEKENLEKMTQVVSAFKGHINAGMMAASYQSFVNKLEEYLSKTNSGYDVNIWGIDQYLYNLLFDFEKDCATGKKWNGILNDIIIEDNDYYLKQYSDNGNGVFIDKEQKANVIHCYGVFSPEEQKPYRFSHFHYPLFSANMKNIILESVKKTI